MPSRAIDEFYALDSEQRARLEEGLMVYRPTETGTGLHTCKAIEILGRGGNQSGKTSCAAAEVASCATGLPIIAEDGTTLERRFPAGKRPLIWVFGFDEKHIGGTIFRKLFTDEDSPYIIDDEQTGLPRLWNPADESDMARKDQRRMAGPLIPPRLIDPKGWAWTDKAQRVCNTCRLKNGAEIRFFTSGGQCPQGVAVDLIWIDEDVADPSQYPDWRARVMKKSGHIISTAFPWARNDRLQQLASRAERERDNPDGEIREFRFYTEANKWLDPLDIAATIRSWEDEGSVVLAARKDGEFPTDNVLMYPTFNRDVHGIDEIRCPDSPAARLLQDRGGDPPDDWMRMLALDPGSARCAVLFCAVPPPDLGNHLFFYDEIFLENTDSEEVAEQVLQRVNRRYFERFIIDNRMGRQTQTDGVKVRDVYLKAFKRRRVESAHGTRFFWGEDHIQSRAEQVRLGLKIHKSGQSPRLMFWLPRLPRTLSEFGKYKRKVLQKMNYQDEPIRAWNDQMDCMGYLVAHNQGYVTPRKGKPVETEEDHINRWIDDFFQTEKKPTSGFTFGAPV